VHEWKTAYAPIERRALRFLRALGIPLQRRFLILPCMTGPDTSGLFTEFLAVVGALAQYEEWPSLYAGLRVDYAGEGLYYDPSAGSNWWEYYFEPIDVGCRDNAVVTPVDPHQHDLMTYRAAAMPRRDGFAIIDKYVRLKPPLARKLDAYVRDCYEDAYVIGIHYRGTDKFDEAPRVPYEAVVSATRDAIARARTDRYKLFLATDEQSFLLYMLERFPGRLLYRPMFRSSDGQPIDVRNDDSNYKKGEDAVMDCLLLSRSDRLIRTASNLSLCSTLFNPGMPEILLNRPYYEPD